MSLTHELTQYGLTHKEAAVYLAGLELGPSPASRIARVVGESRINTYALCQNLVKKQCAYSLKRNRVMHFEMISPEQFLHSIQHKLSQFEGLMPQLLATASKSINKPKVVYYEGLSGLTAMFDEILVSTDYIDGFLGAATMDSEFKKYMDGTFIPTRISKKTPIRVLSPQTPYDQFYKDTEDESYRQVKMVDNKNFKISGETLLYGENNVAIAMRGSEEMIGVTIQSKHFHTTQHSLFKLIWELTD